jgi:hypothetical protein
VRQSARIKKAKIILVNLIKFIMADYFKIWIFS